MLKTSWLIHLLANAVVFLTLQIHPSTDASYMFSPGTFYWSRQKWLKPQRASTTKSGGGRRDFAAAAKSTGSDLSKSKVKLLDKLLLATGGPDMDMLLPTAAVPLKPLATRKNHQAKVASSHYSKPLFSPPLESNRQQQFGDILRIVKTKSSKKRTNHRHNVRKTVEEKPIPHFVRGIVPFVGFDTKAFRTAGFFESQLEKLSKTLARKEGIGNRRKSKGRIRFGPWRGKRSVTQEESSHNHLAMGNVLPAINKSTFTDTGVQRGTISLPSNVKSPRLLMAVWLPDHQGDKEEEAAGNALGGLAYDSTIRTDVGVARDEKTATQFQEGGGGRLFGETLLDDCSEEGEDFHGEIMRALKQEMSKTVNRLSLKKNNDNPINSGIVAEFEKDRRGKSKIQTKGRDYKKKFAESTNMNISEKEDNSIIRENRNRTIKVGRSQSNNGPHKYHFALFERYVSLKNVLPQYLKSLIGHNQN